jgi:predicted GH43/DUF377 family glycosyl hydrolase
LKALFLLVALLLLSIPISAWGGVGGGTWTKCTCNPILSGTPNSWDWYSVNYPRVLYDGQTYRMWYTGSTNATTSQIGYATSSDGVTWTKNPTPVLSPSRGRWDDNSVREGAVIQDGGIFKMWYVATGTSGSGGAIGLATSSDGITWSKDAHNPVISGTAGAYATYPAVIKDGQLYRIWYRSGASGQRSNILQAESADGVSWSQMRTALQAGSSGWDSGGLYSPSVILDAGLYKMWYSGYSGSNYGVGFATSNNGLLWTKYSGNPVLANVDDQQVVLVGSNYRMYHSWGLNTIGYSDAPANTVIPEFSINPQYPAIIGLVLMCVLIARPSSRSVRSVRA